MIRLRPPLVLTAAVLLGMAAHSPAAGVERPQLESHAASARTAALEDLVPPSPAVRIGRLDNGLTYYIRANDQPEQRAELRLVVNAGSVLEDDDQRGLAHFVEHMAFNGTTHFAKQELVAFMESIGMRLGPHVNASTSFDATTYMLQVPTDTPEPLHTALQILQDWAHGLTLDEEEIDRERGVVIEEWRLGQGAFARISDQQLPIILYGSRYAERLPIGTRESLDAAPPAALRRFYRDWYRPDLMSVVAVGDFDAAEIEALVRRQFEDLEGPEDARPRGAYDIPDHEETLFAIATDPEMPAASVTILHKLPPEENRTVGAYRTRFVERLYSSMLNGRLRELLQQEQPPFTFAGTGKGRLLRARSSYSLSAGVEPAGILRGLEAMLMEAERVRQHGFTQAELERVKTNTLRNLERGYAERDNRSSRAYAREYVSAALDGEPIPGIEYELELARRFLPEIALAEVDRAADTWTSASNRVITVSAPASDSVEVPDEAALLAVIDRVAAMELAAYVEELSDAPLVAELPEPGVVVATRTTEPFGITEWTLQNGVRVALMPTTHKDDEIVVRAVSPGGTSLASDADWVAASSAARVIGIGGLGQLSAIDLGKKLTGKAARATASITRYGEGIGGGASPRDVETLFQLIHMLFTAPRADPVAFESFRSRTRTRLENRAAAPQVAFSEDFQRIMAQGHPRSRSLTPEMLDEYDLESSLAFYRERFADADDFVFVFVGAIDLDTIRPLVERYLGSLPALESSETWRDVGVRPPEGVIIRRFFRGIEPQSQTRITFTGPFDYDVQADRTNFQAMIEVLRTRLRNVLREDLGGTYGVSVGGGYDWRPAGSYGISLRFGSDPDRAAELIEQAWLQIETLKTEGPSEQDVADVRASLLRSYETNAESNGWWLGQLAGRYTRGYSDLDNVADYLATVEALSPASIQEAAQRYLDPRNYVQATLYPEPQR